MKKSKNLKTVLAAILVASISTVFSNTFAQVDSVYWYVKGQPQYWYVQQDVWAFRLITGEKYTATFDQNIIKEIEHRRDKPRKVNEVYFKPGSTPADRAKERKRIEQHPKFQCAFKVITRYKSEVNNRLAMKWLSTSDIINVIFNDPDPSQAAIQQFKTKYGLFTEHVPDPALPKVGNSSWTYAFGVNNNFCQTRTSVSVSALIIEQDAALVKIAEPLIEPNEPSQAIEFQQFTTDPYFDDSWHIKNTGQCVEGVTGTADADCDIEEAWNFGYTGTGIKVAIIDKSIFNTNHPDISSKYIDGWDWIQNDADVSVSTGYSDCSKPHGQASAGLIAAIGDNSIGAVGVAPDAQIIPIITWYSTAYKGFQHAFLKNADIISCGWGWTAWFSQAIEDEIIKCNVEGRNKLGIITVCAAGNQSSGLGDFWPANSDYVIGVIASTPNDNKSGFSNYGSPYDVAAPGQNYITTDLVGTDGYNDFTTFPCDVNPVNTCTSISLDNNYTYFGGTSGAAPIVAGVCALILDVWPGWSAQSVQYILQFTAEQVGGYTYTNGKSPELGHGRINAYDAVLFAYDPNNKIVGPIGCGPQHFIEPQDTLTYTVNFQNIGQAPAQLVIIRDTLDNDLDISTLSHLGSKHPFTFQILNGNIAEWTFDPIFLPDSSVDQEDSKGFVKFSILPLQNLTSGTIITNKTGIIFDQNVPVITNEVFNTISISPLPVASILQADQSICEGEKATFTASQGDKYIWNTGDTTQSITVSSAGIYKVKVFYDNACPSPAMAALTVEPNVSNFKIKLQCNSNSYDFTYTGGLQNISFFWDFGLDAAPSTSMVANPTGVTFSSPGAKQITLTISGVVSNCKATIKTLDVLDLSCGNHKVLVCHIESGKPDRTICLNTNALSSHLAHGDCIGPCNNSLARVSNFDNNEELQSSVQNIFEAYPNPFRLSTTLNFILTKDDNVKIEVFNYMGQKLAILYDNFAKANQIYKIKFDTKDLNQGIYFGVLTTNGEKKVLKMLVTK